MIPSLFPVVPLILLLWFVLQVRTDHEAGNEFTHTRTAKFERVEFSSPVRLSQIENTCFSLTFFGEGYSEGTDPSQGRPDARICTQVVGAGKPHRPLVLPAKRLCRVQPPCLCRCLGYRAGLRGHSLCSGAGGRHLAGRGPLSPQEVSSLSFSQSSVRQQAVTCSDGEALPSRHRDSCNIDFTARRD